MRVPVLVPIGPHTVRLRYLARLPDENDYGQYVVEDREIHVSKARCTTAAVVWATVWHELAHAAVALAGGGRLVKLAREEAIVGAIEVGVAPLMLFNPKAPGVRWREVAFPWE